MLYTNSDLGHFAKDPAVTKAGGSYWLYHSVMVDGRLGIGISRSDDGDSFERTAILPVTLHCEENGVGAPGCIKIGGVIHLFY